MFIQIDDPFTRRSTKPRMNFKAAPEEQETPEIVKPIEKPVEKVEEKKETPLQVTQEDLFSAHDFDITIDLEVPLPGNFILQKLFY